MSIMSTLINFHPEPAKPRQYPYLGATINESGTLVVLFNTITSGTVVVGNKVHIVGYYSDGWCEELFEILPRETKITLENQ